MGFLGEGERPRGALEPVRQRPLTLEEERSVTKQPEGRNPFAELLAGETPPYSPEVFDRVHLKLVDMIDDYPSQDWYGSELSGEDKDDVLMVAEGFRAVAYDHVSGDNQAALQDRFYEAATGEGGYRVYPVEERFTENYRLYRDRFELTFRQAKAVQKVMRYLGEDYDPGGEEPTPENLDKRTFSYDAYLGRPIRKDYPDQPDTLIAQPEHAQEIADYLRAKQQPR
jgi:hypothetical protein